jgi:hypothetical protein
MASYSAAIEEGEMPNLQSFKHIEDWLKIEGNTVDKLRNETMHSGRRKLADHDTVVAWLREQERLGVLAKESEEHEFMRRQTVAAEDAAKAAKLSARWAVLGGLIALAMLVATAWPYFKLMDALSRLAK